MTTLKRHYIVEKRNVLNEIRANTMTLQELRFFSIYLAKINSRNVNTRLVRFSLDDFQKIMDFNCLNIAQLREAVDKLLCKIVEVPLEEGCGFKRFQLFKKCVVSSDEDGYGYIEIDAHDESLPLMFEFKEKYFSYELWNALKLKSANQLRMYEILKQYEGLGARVVMISELKDLLGIEPDKYTRFGDFKSHVLEPCRLALEECTDIKYTYEPYQKLGRGGKITALKFTISKNMDYIDHLTLRDFLSDHELIIDVAAAGHEPEPVVFHDETLFFMSDACNNEFNEREIQVLYNLVKKAVPYQHGVNNMTEMYDYLKRKYDELEWRGAANLIKNRIGYLKKIIEVDIDSQY